MKLNPLETAPKDGRTILALFEGGKYLYSAIWCNDRETGTGCWTVALGLDNGFFSINPLPNRKLTGWLPMPQIDDEGNWA